MGKAFYPALTADSTPPSKQTTPSGKGRPLWGEPLSTLNPKP